MLVKMKFLGISGPIDQIDRVTEQYLANREFHLENSISELKDLPSVSAFTDENPYKDLLAQSQGLVSIFPHEDIIRPIKTNLDIHKIEEIIRSFSKEAGKCNNTKVILSAKLTEVEHELSTLEPFKALDANLDTLQSFSHLVMNMGRFTSSQYTNFVSYAESELDCIFIKTFEDTDFVYGVYFAPNSSVKAIDERLKSFNFSWTKLKRHYNTPPSIAYDKLLTEQEEIKKQISELDEALNKTLQDRKSELLLAHHSLLRLSNNFDIRNYAAITENGHQKFFVICGWMPIEDAEEIKELINDDPYVYYDTHIGDTISRITPPTMIKNPKFFKPFESFIKMYGIPNYKEFDPTIFLALTYTFMFGAMFGDAGQGLLLVIGGFLLYRLKKIDLAAIIGFAGIFSMIFGILYGSVFGFEDLIHPIWMNPMKNIQSALIVSISFGIGLIILTMILNIINGIRSKDWERVLLSPSGIVGLIFYSSVLIAALLAILGKPIPAAWILIIIIGIPLVIIGLQKPIGNAMKKKKLIEGSKGNFFIEAFFELFEIILNYITNTISFVRVGAFALSHAGMMFVVMELADIASGSPNWLMVILGNLLVMGLEGLIVGIQVLRLEYYELFSRFYTGDGREFKSYLK